jgi:hypothetical protein
VPTKGVPMKVIFSLPSGIYKYKTEPILWYMQSIKQAWEEKIIGLEAVPGNTSYATMWCYFIAVVCFLFTLLFVYTHWHACFTLLYEPRPELCGHASTRYHDIYVCAVPVVKFHIPHRYSSPRISISSGCIAFLPGLVLSNKLLIWQDQSALVLHHRLPSSLPVAKSLCLLHHMYYITYYWLLLLYIKPQG